MAPPIPTARAPMPIFEELCGRRAGLVVVLRVHGREREHDDQHCRVVFIGHLISANFPI